MSDQILHNKNIDKTIKNIFFETYSGQNSKQNQLLKNIFR